MTMTVALSNYCWSAISFKTNDIFIILIRFSLVINLVIFALSRHAHLAYGFKTNSRSCDLIGFNPIKGDTVSQFVTLSPSIGFNPIISSAQLALAG